MFAQPFVAAMRDVWVWNIYAQWRCINYIAIHRKRVLFAGTICWCITDVTRGRVQHNAIQRTPRSNGRGTTAFANGIPLNANASMSTWYPKLTTLKTTPTIHEGELEQTQRRFGTLMKTRCKPALLQHVLSHEDARYAPRGNGILRKIMPHSAE